MKESFKSALIGSGYTGVLLMLVINVWFARLQSKFINAPRLKINLCLASLFLALISSFNVMAQGIPADLQKAWQATKLATDNLSLVIRDANSGAVISQINPNTPRNPASVMKVVTTWAALSELGSNFTWYTRFYSKAHAKVDNQGTLSGPLYIKAGGDPWFTVEDLWKSLRELRLRGIKNLSEVIVDRSLFGDVAIRPGDFDNSADRPYNASPDAMMVNFGAVRILFSPDADNKQWIPIVDPPTRNIKIDGVIEWQNGSCKGSPPVSVSVQPSGSEAIIKLAGKAIGSCGEFSVYRLVNSQANHFDALFKLIWKELGGTIGHGITDGKMPANAKLIFSHASPPLSDVIRQVNKYSNNVMARMTLLSLGANTYGNGATKITGANAIKAILDQQGINTNGWVLDNGSGLSRSGRITAGGLAQMLEIAWHSPLMPEFVSSLAISGVDGTMRRRLRNDLTRGQAHMKTGTLRNSRALAGYVKSTSGKQFILVSMVNSQNPAAIRSFDDAVIKWLTEQ